MKTWKRVKRLLYCVYLRTSLYLCMSKFRLYLWERSFLCLVWFSAFKKRKNFYNKKKSFFCIKHHKQQKLFFWFGGCDVHLPSTKLLNVGKVFNCCGGTFGFSWHLDGTGTTTSSLGRNEDKKRCKIVFWDRRLWKSRLPETNSYSIPKLLSVEVLLSESEQTRISWKDLFEDFWLSYTSPQDQLAQKIDGWKNDQKNTLAKVTEKKSWRSFSSTSSVRSPTNTPYISSSISFALIIFSPLEVVILVKASCLTKFEVSIVEITQKPHVI